MENMGNLIGKVKKIWQILDFFKMSSQTLVLSASGLKNIVLNSQEKEDEFKFIFGDKEIKLHRLFAEFVSPKVAHMHQCDPTIDHLNLSDLTKNISTFDSKIQSEILTERTFIRLKHFRLVILLKSKKATSTIFSFFQPF